MLLNREPILFDVLNMEAENSNANEMSLVFRAVLRAAGKPTPATFGTSKMMYVIAIVKRPYDSLYHKILLKGTLKRLQTYLFARGDATGKVQMAEELYESYGEENDLYTLTIL
jgi:hypothetical protein